MNFDQVPNEYILQSGGKPDSLKFDFLRQERSVLGRVFQVAFETVHILDNFHIYSVDCRGETSLRNVVKRVDKLMTNESIPQKEIVFFPIIFRGHLPADEDLVNINARIHPDYKCNYISGVRKEPSKLNPGYVHHISWVAIVLSKILHDKSKDLIPGVFEGHFKNTIQFMRTFVPEDTGKFLKKLDTIKRQLEPRREIEQYFGICKKVRPELYEAVEDIEHEVLKNYPKVANDVMDLIYATDMVSAPEEAIKGILLNG